MRRRPPWQGLGIALLALLLCLPGGPAAHEVDRLRIDAGLDLFPSFLAADLDIADKTNADGALTLVLLHHDADAEAQRLAAVLRRVGKIRNLPIQVRVVEPTALEEIGRQPVAGIFLVQHLGDSQLAIALEFSRRARALLISPHEGDVEHGASGGIHVSDRLLPLVNMRTLEENGIRLKPFFLRIAEKYGE